MTGVWAEHNDRPSIFAARSGAKEVFSDLLERGSACACSGAEL